MNDAQRQALEGCVNVRDKAAEFIRQVEKDGVRFFNDRDGSDATDALLQTAQNTVDRMDRVIAIYEEAMADDQDSK